MNIPWKLKSKIFQIIDILNMPSILYFMQKNITKHSKISTLEIDEIWKRHKKSLLRYDTTRFVFEFGAGKNLAQNLFLSDIVDQQLVVDLNPMVDLKLVNTVRKLISKKIKLRSRIDIKNIGDIKSYGIIYRAPYDAAKTDLKSKSLDACISSVTLEHIPKNNIIEIFNELSRILKDDGIVSATIDYSDHYAHTDPSISLLNYLYFSESEWEVYNHKCHYQNRLRHLDYKEIFFKCGFEIIEEILFYQEDKVPENLKYKYRHYDPTWCATSSYVVLKKVNI